MSYNLSPAPNAAGKPHRPMADGRCTFSARDLAAARFETLRGDGVEDKAARALEAGLGWDRPPVNKELRALFRSAKKIVKMALDRRVSRAHDWLCTGKDRCDRLVWEIRRAV